MSTIRTHSIRAACALLSCLPAAAQVSQAWLTRTAAPGDSWDRPVDLEVDRAGSVWVTGTTKGAPTASEWDGELVRNFATARYGTGGETLWVDYFGRGAVESHTVEALAVDDAGRATVTGQVMSACTTLQYGPDGARRWMRQEAAGGGSSRGSALELDALGAVHVAGFTAASYSSDSDFLVLRYGPDGDLCWRTVYADPAGRWDRATALTVDQNGDVYVTGTSSSSSNGSLSDVTTVKLDSSGQPRWARTFDGDLGKEDEAVALAVHPDGGVVIAASSMGLVPSTGFQRYDFVTIRYDADGNTLWVRRFDRAGLDDHPVAIGADRLGHVIVAGNATPSLFITTAVTLKYTAQGQLVWGVEYDDPGTTYNPVGGLAVDPAGNAYVVSNCRDQSWAGATGMLTYKLGPGGQTLWRARAESSWGGISHPSDIELDPSGNVYVTGQVRALDSPSQLDFDFVTIKYAQGAPR